jgi:eukaryotic-like serine/threonine-protein kinase
MSEPRVVLSGGFSVRYLPTGHLLYAHSGSLFAARFDVSSLRVTGSATEVVKGVVTSMLTGSATYDVSTTGTLIYVAGESEEAAGPRLTWIDREGNETPIAARSPFGSVRVSRDGTRAAVAISAAVSDIGVVDLERGAITRVTTRRGPNRNPIWTPDGARITFSTADDAGARALAWAPADGSGDAEILEIGSMLPDSWSPDGAWLAFSEQVAGRGSDIGLLSVKGARTRRPFLATAASESNGAFSPNGRWIAYESDESGRVEVYVRPFPGPGPKLQVSVEGGSDPRWAKQGSAIVFRNGEQLMAAPVAGDAALKIGLPTPAFKGSVRDYDVATDGRILAVKGPPVLSRRVVLVQNWFDELKRRASTRNAQ